MFNMLSKGMIALMEDLSKEFAAGTGMVLTGINLRPTVTGWTMMVKGVTTAREAKILFIEAWTVNECLEYLFKVIREGDRSGDWREDKYPK